MRFLVIGGDAAGLSAASQIRRRRKEDEIVVLEKKSYVSYGLCGLPFFIRGDIEKTDELISKPKEFFERERKINILTEHEAIEIRREKKVVVARDKKTGNFRELPYDKLIIATGARPFLPEIEGLNLEGVFTLHSLEEGEEIREYLKRDDVKRVALVGAGYVNLELVDAMRAYGKKVLIIEMLDRLLFPMHDEFGNILLEELKSAGVEVELGKRLERIEGEKKVEKVIAGGKTYEVEMVVASLGVIPNSELAKEAGLSLTVKNAIKVDSRMKTSDPDIFAAGDCIGYHHLLKKEPAFLPLGDLANKSGVVAGENAAGGYYELPPVLGTQGTEVLGIEIARTGLTLKEALDEGYEAHSTFIKSSSRAHYMPGRKPLWINIVYTRDGKLLGAESMGYEGVMLRINAISMLIAKGGTVYELAFSDFVYVPPHSPVWDPLQQAGRVALKTLEKLSPSHTSP